MSIINYTKTCSKNVPGVGKVFFSEVGNIDTITIGSNLVSAVSMDTTDNEFHEFQADLDSVEYRSEGAGGSSYFTNHMLEMGFGKLSASLFAAKASLVDSMPCGLVAIYIDGNGACWLVGWNDTDKEVRTLNTIADNFKTGKKPSDEDGNVFTITVSGESGYDIIPFDTTLTASIVDQTTAAEVFI
ncbi:unnamed protein product [marine sediment metagenome]|uniref:Phage tail protein n=1 Tax=marine sediment metagenome TaxID=412755 RepID=X0TWF8_9ZZZZ